MENKPKRSRCFQSWVSNALANLTSTTLEEEDVEKSSFLLRCARMLGFRLTEKDQDVLMFLTPPVAFCIRRSIRCSQLVLALPFEFESEDSLRIRLQSGWKMTAFRLNYLIAIGHTGFVWYSCWTTLESVESTEPEKVIAVYMTIYWSFQVFLTTGFVVACDEFVEYLNKGVLFLEDYSRRFENGEGGHVKQDRVPLLTRVNQFLCFATWYGLFVVYVLLSLWSILDPKMTTLVGPFLSSNRWVSGIISGAVVLYVRWTFACVATVTMLNMVAVLVGALAVDQEMQPRLFKEPQDLHDSIKYYNEVRLLMELFNNVYSPIILPSTEFFFLGTCTFGFYGAITLQGYVALVTGILAVYTYFALVLMFRMPAEFYSRSNDNYLWQWRRLAALAVDRRRVRAAKPWKVVCGQYAFVDMALILTVTQLIVENVVQLLIFR